MRNISDNKTTLNNNDLSILEPYKNISTIVTALLKIWPDHAKYCRSRFLNDDEQFLIRMENVSSLICKIVRDNIDLYCTDYRWMCEEFLKEELYFRRNDAYRLSTFSEAFAEVYSDDSYMSRYVRGILISQLIWKPHAQAIDYFQTTFLERLPENSSYLEVGPGHGLFLYLASQRNNLASLEAWDVSDSSIAETQETLQSLGVTRAISIVQQDILKAPDRHEEFDGAVISEVLEHLERPDLALRSLHAALRPGGRIFINAPLNSPAPDHIYLWRTSEEFSAFVTDQGFEIESSQLFPVTGATVEQAVRNSLSISCVVIAKKG